MTKRARQYIGLITAIIAYYVIHEGAHLIYALLSGTFKQINFMGLGMQIDIYSERMSETELGVFCILGSAATLITAYVLILLAERIGKSKSKVLKACCYYVTIAMLLLDPIYLSVLCGFFGGGDMNGISFLMPEIFARILYGVILAVNGLIFWKIVLPKYNKAFAEPTNE